MTTPRSVFVSLEDTPWYHSYTVVCVVPSCKDNGRLWLALWGAELDSYILVLRFAPGKVSGYAQRLSKG